MLATAHARTAKLVKGRHVPVIQDTTSLRGLEDGSRLFDCTEGLPGLGRETVALPAAPGLPASRDRAADPGPARPWAGRRLAAVRLH
jgi:hypothetical protein